MDDQTPSQNDFDRNIWSSFEPLWLKLAETNEENSFLEFFRRIYFFALEKREGNKDTYLKLAKRYAKHTAFTETVQNIFIPFLSSAWKVLGTVVAGGFLKDRILKQVWAEWLETLFSGLFAFSMIIALFLLIICGLIVIIQLFYKRIKFEYEEKILQRKETWIRHSEALFAYQYEICTFRFQSNEYAKPHSPQERKLLFMERIMDAAKANNNKFVSNMTLER